MYINIPKTTLHLTRFVKRIFYVCIKINGAYKNNEILESFMNIYIKQSFILFSIRF